MGCAVEFYFEGMSPKTVAAAAAAAAAGAVTAPSSPLAATGAVEIPASPILKAQLCAPPKPSAARKDAPKNVKILLFHYFIISTSFEFDLI